MSHIRLSEETLISELANSITCCELAQTALAGLTRCENDVLRQACHTLLDLAIAQRDQIREEMKRRHAAH